MIVRINSIGKDGPSTSQESYLTVEMKIETILSCMITLHLVSFS